MNKVPTQEQPFNPQVVQEMIVNDRPSDTPLSTEVYIPASPEDVAALDHNTVVTLNEANTITQPVGEQQALQDLAQRLQDETIERAVREPITYKDGEVSPKPIANLSPEAKQPSRLELADQAIETALLRGKVPFVGEGDAFKARALADFLSDGPRKARLQQELRATGSDTSIEDLLQAARAHASQALGGRNVFDRSVAGGVVAGTRDLRRAELVTGGRRYDGDLDRGQGDPRSGRQLYSTRT